jgi:hypothetical protein
VTDETTPDEATPEDPEPTPPNPEAEAEADERTEWTTRNNFRAGLVARITEGLISRQQTIESGPLEGLEVISAGHVAEVLGMALREPLPPYSITTAEVATPATLVVTAFCPRCRLPALMLMSVTSQLVVEAGGGELRLKGHTKAVSHVCGQLALPIGPEGQASFELEDIVGEDDALTEGERTESGIPLTICPFPGCILREEHEGDHDVPPADALDDDPPTLPTP